MRHLPAWAAAVAAAATLACRGPQQAARAQPEASYSATVRVEAQGTDGRRQSAHGFLAVAPPDRLRLELLDPVGRTRLVALVASGRSWVVGADAYADVAEGRQVLAAFGHPGVDVRRLVDVLLARGADAGTLGEGVSYRREAGAEGRWPRRVELTSGEGRLQIRLGDVEPLRARGAFDPPPTERLALRPLPELMSSWDEEGARR